LDKQVNLTVEDLCLSVEIKKRLKVFPMFYKPNFCCHCGEKIARPNPSFTDSKRFCDVCKHDFVLQRAMPFGFCILMALIGIFGVGSYWRSGDKPLNLTSRQIPQSPSNSGKTSANQTSPISSNSNASPTVPANNVPTNAAQITNLTAKPPARPPSAPVSREESVYYCGAPTKKGTPCSRRVKGGGRCWQHQGQNAMLPPEKLLVSQ